MRLDSLGSTKEQALTQVSPAAKAFITPFSQVDSLVYSNVCAHASFPAFKLSFRSPFMVRI